MADPKPNVELIDKTLDAVWQAARKGKWDQTEYRQVKECGTAMCFAGWAIHIQGGQWVYDDPNAPVNDTVDFGTLLATSPRERGAFKTEDGTWVVSAEDRATRLLGLTLDERDRLFDPYNTLERIIRITNEIKDRAKPRRRAS